MKKVVRILLAIVMVMCLTLTITACKNDCQKGNHTWDDGKVTSAPTCTEKGVKTYTCVKCNETKTEDIDKLGHDFENGIDKGTTEATCTSAAIQTIQCARCSETTTKTVGSPLSHNPSNTWQADAVKNTHYKTCANGCGLRIDEHAIDFVLDAEQPNAPTCEQAGSLSYHCTHEGCTVTNTDEQAKLGHSPATEWSHGEIDGKDMHWHECTREDCSAKLDLAECSVDVTAYIHENIGGVNKHYNVCSVCETHYNEENCAATGEYQIDTALNKHYKTCDKCEYRLEEADHDALGELVKSAEGHAHKCSACGNTPVLTAHTEVEIPAVATTCNEDGTTAGVKCSECEYVITAPEIDTKRPKHNYEWIYGADRADDMLAYAHYQKCNVCNTVDESSKSASHTLVMTQGDKDYHWEACECGYADLENKSAHNYETELVCPVCNKVPEHIRFALRIGNGEYQSWHDNVAAEQNVTLQEVVNRVPANSSATIYIGMDIEDGVGIFVSNNKNITFRFNNHTYNVSRETVGSAGTENQAFHLEQGSTVAIYNATITATASNVRMLVQNYSNLTLDNVKLNAADNANVAYVLSNNAGTVVLRNDTELRAHDGKVAMDVYYNLKGYYPAGVSVTVESGCLVSGIIEYGADVETDGWTDKTVLSLPSKDRNYNIRFTTSNVTCETANITKGGDRLTHEEDNGIVTTEPTCAVKGVKTYTCTRCGHTRTEDIAALGHDFATVLTTDAEELTHYYACSRCDERQDETECTFETRGAVAATCISTGMRGETYCSVCNHVYEKNTATNKNSANHEGSLEWTTDGEVHYQQYSCCHAEDTDNLHEMEWVAESTTATCVSDGVTTYKCGHEGCTLTKTENVSALGHTYGDFADDNNGETHTKTCTRTGCTDQTEGHTVTENHEYVYISVDNDNHTKMCDCGYEADEAHIWNNGEVTTAPTCTENGVKTYTCTADGCGGTKTEVIAKLGHEFAVTYSVDDETGKHYRSCTHAGCTVRDDEHEPDMQTTLSATCTSAGTETSVCQHTNCSVQTSKDVAALGHNVETATYQSEGKHIGECARCNETVTEDCNADGANGECSACGRKISLISNTQEATINASTSGMLPYEKDGLSVTYTNFGTNNGNNYSPFRFYGGDKLTFKVLNGTVNEIIFTYTQAPNVKLTINFGNINNDNTVWTGVDISEVTIQNGANNSTKQAKISQIVINYTVTTICYHDNVRHIESAIQADCVTMGFSGECYYCPDCGHCYQDANCVNDADVTVTPALSENGEHSYGDVVAVRTATCVETGVKVEHKHCSVCGQYVSADGTTVLSESDVIEAVNANNHAYGEWQQSGTEAEPTHTRICGNDNTHTETVACQAADGAQYLTSPTHHWKECATCGNTIGYVEHDFTNGDCVCGASSDTKYLPINVTNAVSGTPLTETVATVNGLSELGIVGQSYTFTVTVTGYRVESVVANGTELTAVDGVYTYTVVDGDNNIVVNLVKLVKLSVTVNGETLGSVTPSINLDSQGIATVDKGTELSLNVGYDASKVTVGITVNGTAVTDINAAITLSDDTEVVITFCNVVTVTYDEELTIANGMVEITVDGETLTSGDKVAVGSTLAITIAHDGGYEVTSVKVGEDEATLSGDTYTYLSPDTLAAGTELAVTVTIEEIVLTEQAVATLTFTKTTMQSGVSSYTGSFKTKCDDLTWTISNFNNNNLQWSYIKCGSKQSSSVAKITTDKALSQKITKIALTIDAITATSVNSITLKIADNAEFNNSTDVSVNKSTGEQFIVIPSPAENMYYQLVFDCAKSSNNGIVTVSKVEYFAFV